ncbi:alpha/beta fold hydrolase [Edaphobacillus lindanitolerans]|uniref:Lysophospholipase, alpha-beta hydrolase superfamily n=1 Tax=Edaphobacillus lindanitolerans TaxID=550447 RepID=A0A1U7PHE1_9BACI|nr:alpha/beta hydrolase [Edaphobacillus lindanitolerans]SIT66978.1 Lysophospholipase, alpha-beta hydrolase superfamily [Edaphobacillus lindanitolerans]
MERMTIQTTDGHMISAFVLEPAAKPIGHIHLLHGMAEHIGRYGGFAEKLREAGYLVSGHDHRGHGETWRLNGTKGYFAEENGFERVVRDAFEVITAVREKHPSPNLILFGHSMGSFVARRYAQLFGNTLDGAIFMGSGAHPGPVIAGGRLLAGAYTAAGAGKEPNQLLNSLTFGRYNSRFGDADTPFAWLSDDAEEVRAYMDDEDSGFVSTTGLFSDLFDGLDLIHRDREIRRMPATLPILFISGASDPVGADGKGIFKAAEQLVKNGVQDVTVHLVEDGRHEILHSRHRDEVTRFLVGWLERWRER